MALSAFERRIVEMIRGAENVYVSINYGTKDEITLKVGGRCPHDIALAVQALFNEEKNN